MVSGDLARVVMEEGRYGDGALQKFAAETGLDYSTLRGYAQVRAAYGENVPRWTHSWSVFRELAAQPDRLENGKLVAIELDLTPKRTKDYERILRPYKHQKYDLLGWYVVPGAVDRVVKMVQDNRADDCVQGSAWKPTYVTTLH